MKEKWGDGGAINGRKIFVILCSTVCVVCDAMKLMSLSKQHKSSDLE